MKKSEMLFTVDKNTKASNPGQISISKKKFLDYYRISGIERLIYNLLFSVPKNILYKFFHKNKYVYLYIQKQEQFEFGCVNPSIIIHLKKGLIATYTNLTSIGDEVTPVIKISKEPLRFVTNTTLKDRQRIATVSLYYRNSENIYATAWDNFYPKIANCFTDDLEKCNYLLSKLNENSWKCLELGLLQIDNLEQIGLYPIKLEKKLVHSAH